MLKTNNSTVNNCLINQLNLPQKTAQFLPQPPGRQCDSPSSNKGKVSEGRNGIGIQQAPAVNPPCAAPCPGQNYFQPHSVRPVIFLRGSTHGPLAQAKLLSGFAPPANHFAGRLNAGPLCFFDPPKSQRHRSKRGRAILGLDSSQQLRKEMIGTF
jgi:hypothetical protein